MDRWRQVRRFQPSEDQHYLLWDTDLSFPSVWKTMRALKVLACSDLDFWNNTVFFKDKNIPEWTYSGSSHHSKPSIRLVSQREDAPSVTSREEHGLGEHRLRQRFHKLKFQPNSQANLLKVKSSLLQQSQTFPERLSETLAALKEDREAAVVCCLEKNQHGGQDKVSHLNLDMSNQVKWSPASPPASNSLIYTNLPETKYENQDAQETMNREDELEQGPPDLEVLLKESRGLLGQSRDKEFSTDTCGLECSFNRLNGDISGVLMDKDHLDQEKAELEERIQELRLQLEMETREKQDFAQQINQLMSELAQAESRNRKQNADAMLTKADLVKANEINEKLSCDVAKATDRLSETLNQLHDLEADKLLQANQITALELERLQLIGEKNEARKTLGDQFQEQTRELGERCCPHREQRNILELENLNLRIKCRELEEKTQILEADCNRKERELRRLVSGFAEEKNELQKVAEHWTQKWLDVAMTLDSTQAQLDQARRQGEEPDGGKNCSPDQHEELFRELEKMKEEHQTDTLEIRNTEMEEQQQQLNSSGNQELEWRAEVRRLEKLLEEREQELREKEQDIQEMERECMVEREAARVQQPIFGQDARPGKESAINYSPEDFECLKSQAEESSRQAEQLKPERSHSTLALTGAPRGVQTETQVQRPTNREKLSPISLVDPNEQRRLVTEQLKSLFKERGERSPVLQRRPGLFDKHGVLNAKSMTNVDAAERRKTARDQQGAAKDGTCPSDTYDQSNKCDVGEERNLR